MNPAQNSSLIPDQLDTIVEDSFIAVPRNRDTAVVYWSVSSNRNLPYHEGGRLALQVVGLESGSKQMIFLHRETGHFIVPFMAEEREYRIEFGWSDANGFSTFFDESIQLEALATENDQANPTVDYRGSVFWGQHVGSAN